jgi:hypothetical protein
MDFIDGIILVGISALIVVVGVKLYELRQDVLYGPYIRDQLDRG